MSEFDDLASEFVEHKDDRREEAELMMKARDLSIIIRVLSFFRCHLQLFYTDPIDQHPKANQIAHVSISPNRFSTDSGVSLEKFEQHRRYIKFYSLPNIFKKQPTSDAIPLRNFIYHCVCIYILIKLFFVSYFHFIMANFMQTWRPIVRSGANRTEMCALRVDLDEKYDSSAARFVMLRDFFLDQGYTAIYSAQLMAFAVLSAVSAAMILYAGMFTYKNDSLPLNTLSFQLCPIEERIRVRMRLLGVVQTLYTSSEMTDESPNYDRNDHLGSMRFEHSHRSEFFPSRSARSRPESAERECSCLEQERMRIRFVDLITREKLVDFTWPINLSSSFYQYLMARQMIATIIQLTILILAFIWIPMTCANDEVANRVRSRQEQYKCELWNENGTQIRDIVGLLYRPLPPDKRKRYMNHITRSETNLGDLYLIENIEIIKWPAPKVLLEFVFVYFGVIGWSFEYVISFVQASISASQWLCQIQSQMEKCIALIECHMSLKFDSDYTSEDDDESKSRRRDIERALTITYLNFELFRQEYKAFRQVASFLIFHLIPLVTLNSLYSYIMMSASNKNIVIVWVFNASYIIVFNIFVSACVSILERIGKLYATITRILIKSSSVSMELTQIVKLWRRQLLSDADIKNLYGVKVVGKSFSSSTLLAVDSYVMALWLAMARQLGLL